MRIVHIMFMAFALSFSGSLMFASQAAACEANCRGGSCAGTDQCWCNFWGHPRCTDVLQPEGLSAEAVHYWADDAQIAYLKGYIELLYGHGLDHLADSAMVMLEGLAREEAALYQTALDWHEDDLCALAEQEQEALAIELKE